MGRTFPATNFLQMFMRHVVFPMPGRPAIIKCGLLAMDGDHVTVWPPRASPSGTLGRMGAATFSGIGAEDELLSLTRTVISAAGVGRFSRLAGVGAGAGGGKV